jgi:hypothetical protein
MVEYLGLIFVGPSQFLPLAVGLVLWFGLAGIGVLVTGRDGTTEANVIFGWAAVSSLFTLVGVVIRAPFFSLAILAAVGAIAGIVLAIRRSQPLFIPGMWRVLVLALPILFIAGAMEPSQWDEFSHWIPASKYLLAFDGFPNQVKPYNGPHMLSAYPYGWPMLSYLSAQIAGRYFENIGGTLNLMLLLTFSIYALRMGYRVLSLKIPETIGWGFAGAVALFATIFNPTFIQKIVLTAYSDTSTGVVTGFAVLAAYNYLSMPIQRNRASSVSAIWQLSLIFMLLINLRQPNVILVLSIFLGIVLVAARDPDIAFRRFAIDTSLIIIPAIAIFLAWRYYVSTELAGIPGGEAKIRPIETWNVTEIPLILWQMLVIAGKKVGFFAPMALVSILAIGSVFRYRIRFDRFAILCAAAFVGYNSFLMFSYVAHFDTRVALAAGSYWRYNTHVGPLAIVVFVIIAILIWQRLGWFERTPAWPGVVGIILAIILPLVFVQKLRFDLEPPKPHYIAVAKDLKGIVSQKSKIFLLDPKGTGEAALITRNRLNKFGQAWLAAFHRPSPRTIANYVKNVGAEDYVLVHSITPGVIEVLGIDLDTRSSYLVRRSGSSWQVVWLWAKPANHKL